MMVVGFLIVRKTDVFLRYFGDLSELFGIVNARWMSWKVFGIFFIIFGFLIATGLLQAVLYLTVGRLFFFGGVSF
jgi:hypothetical protein